MLSGRREYDVDKRDLALPRRRNSLPSIVECQGRRQARGPWRLDMETGATESSRGDSRVFAISEPAARARRYAG